MTTAPRGSPVFVATKGRPGGGAPCVKALAQAMMRLSSIVVLVAGLGMQVTMTALRDAEPGRLEGWQRNMPSNLQHRAANKLEVAGAWRGARGAQLMGPACPNVGVGVFLVCRWSDRFNLGSLLRRSRKAH